MRLASAAVNKPDDAIPTSFNGVDSGDDDIEPASLGLRDEKISPPPLWNRCNSLTSANTSFSPSPSAVVKNRFSIRYAYWSARLTKFILNMNFSSCRTQLMLSVGAKLINVAKYVSDSSINLIDSLISEGNWISSSTANAFRQVHNNAIIFLPASFVIVICNEWNGWAYGTFHFVDCSLSAPWIIFYFILEQTKKKRGWRPVFQGPVEEPPSQDGSSIIEIFIVKCSKINRIV